MSHWSDGHLYMSVKKGRNVNIRYALIEYGGKREVFDSIHSAEIFCMRHDLDPDKEIQSWDEEIRKICVEEAINRVKALDEAIESLDRLSGEKKAELERWVNKRDRDAQAPGRNWDESLNNEYVSKHSGEATGVFDAIQEVSKVRSKYLNIIWFAKEAK